MLILLAMFLLKPAWLCSSRHAQFACFQHQREKDDFNFFEMTNSVRMLDNKIEGMWISKLKKSRRPWWLCHQERSDEDSEKMIFFTVTHPPQCCCKKIISLIQ